MRSTAVNSILKELVPGVWKGSSLKSMGLDRIKNISYHSQSQGASWNSFTASSQLKINRRVLNPELPWSTLTNNFGLYNSFSASSRTTEGITRNRRRAKEIDGNESDLKELSQMKSAQSIIKEVNRGGSGLWRQEPIANDISPKSTISNSILKTLRTKFFKCILYFLFILSRRGVSGTL